MQLKYRLETNIEIKAIFPGLVPEFYVISACNAANHTYDGTWLELTREQKAKIIGHYYSAFMIEGHKSDTVNDKIKKDSKKRGK